MEANNLQNLRPIFTNHQLSKSLHATALLFPCVQTAMMMDSAKVLSDIRTQLTSNLVAKEHLGNMTNLRWTQGEDGLLHLDGQIYVPEADNLRL